MKIYIFSNPCDLKRLRLSADEIKSVLHRVARETDTEVLVVALYLVHKSKWTGGTAYVRTWLAPAKFLPKRGKWAALGFSHLPDDLPPRFKLIRMALRANPSLYPLTETDRYQWQHSYRKFQDHLAHLFAHELHHYRRYHLGMHPREGEHSANKWALQHVKKLGFQVHSIRLPQRRKKRKRQKKLSFLSILNPMDFYQLPGEALRIVRWHEVFGNIVYSTSQKEKENYIAQSLQHFDRLRSLSPGTRLKVDFDPTWKYWGQEVSIVRPMRRNSVRIVVRTSDGKTWHWPMTWLKIIE